jgi:hypothetical protein
MAIFESLFPTFIQKCAELLVYRASRALSPLEFVFGGPSGVD